MRNNSSVTRRSFLCSATGAALSLPWLESVSAQVGLAKPAQRVAFYYIPIGVIRRGFFPREQDNEIAKFEGALTPSVEGAKFKAGLHELTLTPTLKPLEDVKSKITLITGLDRVFQQGTDVHAQCGSCFLTSAAPHEIKTSAWPLDRTFDHIVADQIGTSTPFRTIELSCNSHKDNKESIYFDNISWYGTGHVAPSMRDPRKVYNRLFGVKEVGATNEITDLVLEDAHSLQKQLSRSDQHKFEEYFESIRSIELRMQRLEKLKDELAAVEIKEPGVSRMPRGEYMNLMGDFFVTALQTGLTNVGTFMVGPERWDTAMMYETLFDKPRSHHQMSHHPRKSVNDLLKIDRFHIEQFAYMVKKMDSIKEADGSTLLDNTIFTAGSGLGDGSTHQYNDLPIIVAGGGRKLNMGSHLHVPNGTPLANLWLTQAHAVGIKRKRFADSTGQLSNLISS